MSEAPRASPSIRLLGILFPLAITFAATQLVRLLEVRDRYLAPLELLVFVSSSFAAVMAVHKLSIRSTGVRMGLGAGARSGLQLAGLAALPMLAVLLSMPMRFRPLALLTEGVTGPIAEEILFRGFLLTELRRYGGLSVSSAIVLSSLAFGLAHVAGGGGLVLLLGTALGGAVFGWLRERLGTLWPAIGLHVLINSAWSFPNVRWQESNWLSVAQVVSLALAVFLSLGWTRGSPVSQELHPRAD